MSAPDLSEREMVERIEWLRLTLEAIATGHFGSLREAREYAALSLRLLRNYDIRSAAIRGGR